MKREIITLKDGRRVELRGLRANENVRMLRDYINAFVKEKAFLLVKKRLSLREERKWLEKTLREVRKGKKVFLAAFHDGKIVGTCEAGLTDGNVELLGVTIVREFRRTGLGNTLMQRVIAAVRKKFRPRIIFLRVMGDNKPARALYKKIGFCEVACLPKWFDHFGKLQDCIYMVLKK